MLPGLARSEEEGGGEGGGGREESGNREGKWDLDRAQNTARHTTAEARAPLAEVLQPAGGRAPHAHLGRPQSGPREVTEVSAGVRSSFQHRTSQAGMPAGEEMETGESISSFRAGRK